VDVLAIAAAAGWLLAFAWYVAATSRPALRAGTVDPGTVDPGQGLATEKPALVNLAVTGCRLSGAAYPATILGLAAGGYLTVAEREAGQMWCGVPASVPAENGLARSERLVLAGARALAAGAGAPFEALAESCASDVRGRWDPFERAVRAEGKQAGIIRPRLPVTARIALYAGAAAVGALVFAAVHSDTHLGPWAPAATAFLAFAVLAYGAHWLGRQDCLTAHGSALGAWATRAAVDMAAAGDMAGAGGGLDAETLSSPAGLTRLAWAVAAGVPVPVPGATPGLASGVRPGHGRTGARTGVARQFGGTPHPSAAWSSYGGQWRLVRIGPASSVRMHPAFWLVLAAWLALIAYVSSLLPDPVGAVVSAVLAAAAVGAAIGGARGLATWLASPAETSFQAQVIARWAERRGNSGDDSSSTCIALDDGERAWIFDVSGRSGQLALGDTVTVRASPRSGKLLGLVPGQDGTSGTAAAPGQAGEAVRAEDPPGVTAGEGADATEPAALLAAGEVSAAVGRPVRVTGRPPGDGNAVYRGDGLTVIVTVAESFLGSLTALARRRGLPLPGVGDEAWLLNRGRTAVLRAGGLTAKVTVGGSAARSLPPDALARLAATVAERLPPNPPSQRNAGLAAPAPVKHGQFGL
jgi:hypothetical protein